MFFFKYRLVVLLIIDLLFFSANICAQNAPQIYIRPLSVNGLQGIHSYAYGQANGKWLIAGGRTDGLHQRQPFSAFDQENRNTQLIVIDPTLQQQWSVPLSNLSTNLQEQLSATNAQFYQNENYLYIIGGYGYSPSLDEHITFPKIIALDVPNIINAIINNQPIENYFRQFVNEDFAVTGGKIGKINNKYYLVGGHRFDGAYNPMGPNHGPGFEQEYTNKIKKFNLFDNGADIYLDDYEEISDSIAFHRRDYNMLPQILPDNTEALTAFSGVFQYNANIPYLHCTEINSTTYTINNTFAQYYNHYHCPVLPAYSQNDKQMHNIFFGGIAQYYDSLGILVQNSDVPFVKTIARITRDENGNLSEHKLPIEMPNLLGAGAELILNENLPLYPNGVLKLDSITADTTLIGHILGGIASSAPNVFWENTGNQSNASAQLFQVFVIKNNSTPTNHPINEQSTNGLQMQVFPNPNKSIFSIQFFNQSNNSIDLSISDPKGTILLQEKFQNLPIGYNIIQKNIENIQNGGTYWVSLSNEHYKATQKIIVEQ